MTTEAIQRLAQQITDGLFTDGQGREVYCLRLEYENGGQRWAYGKQAVRDRIADALTAALASEQTCFNCGGTDPGEMTTISLCRDCHKELTEAS